MRTEVKDERPKLSVTNEVPQSLVLAPVMFLLYVSNMPQGVSTYISLLGDDTKLARKVGNKNNCEELQKYVSTIYEWSKTGR